MNTLTAGTFSADTPPCGSVRDWIDSHAESRPDRVSHLFPGSEAKFTWVSANRTGYFWAARCLKPY